MKGCRKFDEKPAIALKL